MEAIKTIYSRKCTSILGHPLDRAGVPVNQITEEHQILLLSAVTNVDCISTDKPVLACSSV